MPPIHRRMARCRALECRRWASIGPDEPDKCYSCGGEVDIVDMQEHAASLPKRAAVHNHLSAGRRKRGECEACDAEYFTEDKARTEAAKAKGG